MATIDHPARATYREFYRRSIDDPDGFWREQAALIDWHKPFARVLDYTRAPFRAWFAGGETNLCHNAVDRHVASRGAQPALVWISSEVDQKRSFTFAQLHEEVNRCAAVLRSLGVGKGDRVLIYMPMIPEAGSRCSPPCASARSTPSCSAASRPRASPRASTTRARR